MIAATLLVFAFAASAQVAPDVQGARTAPDAGSATQAVEVTPIDANPDDAALEQAESAAAAYSAWQRDLYDALSDSAAPRDWALAAQLYFTDSDRTANPLRPKRDELLDRAMQRAPDDVLVQWLVASDRAIGSTCEARPSPDEALANLKRIDPDNAATWLLALTIAADRHDASAIDEALARMATSSGYDEPHEALVNAWLDVYDAHAPPPASQAALLPKSITDRTAYARFVMAQSQAWATALPGYESLFSACAIGADAAGEWRRFAWCDDAAQVMALHATTLIARGIGFALLRTLDGSELSASDRAARRRYDWLRVTMMQMPDDAVALPNIEARWRASGNEIAFYQRLQRDAGIPNQPPAGWQPPAFGHAVAPDTH